MIGMQKTNGNNITTQKKRRKKSRYQKQNTEVRQQEGPDLMSIDKDNSTTLKSKSFSTIQIPNSKQLQL